MELLQLKYFCHAAETENFSQTARIFMVPPSDVSQSIKRLETELGLPLFDRSANRITLNETGRNFYAHVKEGLHCLEAAVSGIREQKSRLKICVPVHRRIVMQTVERYRRLHPEIELMVQHSETDRYDLLITATPPEGAAAQPILSEEMLLAVQAGDPLATQEVITAADLQNRPFITMSSSYNLFAMTRQICQSMGFRPHIAIQSDDPFYIRRCVELGLGVTIFPAISWRGQFSKEVALRPITQTRRTTYVCHAGPLTPTAREFIRILKEECQKETAEH